MIVLIYYIKAQSAENQVFDPFHILGLEPGAPESEIKKAYRKLSVLYHPDKNPDPDANKYFVEKIAKAYQALTDPISRENYEKYGHPDGRQTKRTKKAGIVGKYGRCRTISLQIYLAVLNSHRILLSDLVPNSAEKPIEELIDGSMADHELLTKKME